MDWAKNLQKIFLDGRKTTSESSVIEVYRKKKKNQTKITLLFLPCLPMRSLSDSVGDISILQYVETQGSCM